MIRKYIDKIADNGRREDMEKLGDMLSEIIYMLKDSHHELYEMAFGKTLSLDMANKWVEDMKPVGMYWNIDETTNAMQSLNLNFDQIDFYVVANMMYNDYYDIVNEDETLALKLAKDWLLDKDSVENKVYEYWKHIAYKD